MAVAGFCPGPVLSGRAPLSDPIGGVVLARFAPTIKDLRCLVQSIEFWQLAVAILSLTKAKRRNSIFRSPTGAGFPADGVGPRSIPLLLWGGGGGVLPPSLRRKCLLLVGGFAFGGRPGLVWDRRGRASGTGAFPAAFFETASSGYFGRFGQRYGGRYVAGSVRLDTTVATPRPGGRWPTVVGHGRTDTTDWLSLWILLCCWHHGREEVTRLDSS